MEKVTRNAIPLCAITIIIIIIIVNDEKNVVIAAISELPTPRIVETIRRRTVKNYSRNCRGTDTTSEMYFVSENGRRGNDIFRKIVFFFVSFLPSRLGFTVFLARQQVVVRAKNDRTCRSYVNNKNTVSITRKIS